MSLPRFFLNEQVLGKIQQQPIDLDLSPDDVKHAAVLRLQPGEHVAVVDADQDYFECEIVDATGGLSVRIASRGEGAPARPRIVLAQGLAKGEKMDVVVRHATEAGTDAFLPFACRRSVVKLDGKKAAARRERWQAIAKSAAMQSGRESVPLVEAVGTVSTVAAAAREADCVLVCWEEAPGTCVLEEALARAFAPDDLADPTKSVLVVVGPEGGIDPEEVERLLAAGPQARLVTLGPYILRTETAGIVATALVAHELRRQTRKGA
ncbi:RsmE family RNA methyltransferase [Eggerthellaceae bacterium zg-893]|nr:RsmE family RNA methyltransferase [Eggerthellaceae bacterium zg-893]